MRPTKHAGVSVVAIGRLQQRGQVTVPASVRRALGMKPGDRLMFVVTGERECRVRVLPGVRDLEVFWRRYRTDGPVPEDLWSQAMDDMADEVLRGIEGSKHHGLSEVAATSEDA